MIRAVLICIALATPAWADPRPLPDYFLDAIVATATAQELARACPSVSIDPVLVSKASGVVLSRLQADGFDMTADELGRPDASQGIKLRLDAFAAKHRLADRATTVDACAVARIEMIEGTQIGSYLVEVAQ